MRYDVLSLFPEFFQGPFSCSILKRAIDSQILEINLVDIRDFSENRHQKVDDRPYGGGPGMVLMPGPVVRAIRSVKSERSRVIYVSPQGKPFNAAKAKALAKEKHLILLSGHYEGVDERVLQKEVDEEISIGDYVLTCGGAAVIVLIQAISRFIPGVIGHELAAQKDSFEDGILDCPHYTRPEVFEGSSVPEVLLSGHHEKIEEWRKHMALEKTKRVRPDILV